MIYQHIQSQWVYNMHIVLDKKLNSDLFKNDNTE